jgi:hypothetical protein
VVVVVVGNDQAVKSCLWAGLPGGLRKPSSVWW